MKTQVLKKIIEVFEYCKNNEIDVYLDYEDITISFCDEYYIKQDTIGDIILEYPNSLSCIYLIDFFTCKESKTVEEILKEFLMVECELKKNMKYQVLNHFEIK